MNAQLTRRNPETPEEWFHRRATYYVEAQILFHLNQAGVLPLLARGDPFKVGEIAAAQELEARPLSALLEYVYEIDDLLMRDAEDRYSLTDYGKSVVARFSTGAAPLINMFDVRVGAYGEVWRCLGGMLTGSAQYGRELHRDGRYAEKGVLKLGRHFLPTLTSEIDELRPKAIVEVGLTTNLLGELGTRYPACLLYGLDRSTSAVMRAGAAYASLSARCLVGDFFDVDGWVGALDRTERGLIFSLHFHELLAQGEGRFTATLQRLGAELPGWRVIAIEQPRPTHGEKLNTPESLWLYAQSNVLIHHLIGNGRILDREEWKRIGHDAGCSEVSDAPCGYLGYRAFVYSL